MRGRTRFSGTSQMFRLAVFAGKQQRKPNPTARICRCMWIYHYCVRILECAGLALSRNKFSGGTSGYGECRCRTRKPAFAFPVGAVYSFVYMYVQYNLATLGRGLWRALLPPLASQYLSFYLALDCRKCEPVRRSSRKRAKEKWRRGESNPRPKSATPRSLHAYLSSVCFALRA
jgi:hypothetical protein